MALNNKITLSMHSRKDSQETRRPRSGAQSGSHIYQSLQTLSESKFAKIQISHCRGGGGELVETNFQLLILSPKLLKSKVPIFGGGGGGLAETNFQLLLLSQNLLKSKVPLFRGGRAHGNQFPTFVAESKFAKIQRSHFWGGGGSWKPISNF